MFLTLVRTELARHLRDYRLLVLYLGGPLLIVAATLAHLDESGERRTAWSRLARAAAEATNLEQAIIPRPLPTLGFLRAASREEWGEAAVIRPHLVDVPEARVADRSYLFAAAPLDWGVVVIFFYSLMAVALTYDAVAGEKAAGTLRLVASRPLGRLPLLLGKVLSGSLVVAGSLVLGVLAGLAVLVATARVVLDLSQGAILVLATVEMLLFLFFNVLLGVAASVSTAVPGTALQRALGAWTLLALAVPGFVVVFGSAFHPVESELDFQRNRDLHQSDYGMRLGVSSMPLREIVRSPGISPAEKRRRIADLEADLQADQEVVLAEMEQGYAALRREYLLRSAAQEEWIDRWSALSPHTLLRSSLDRLALAGASGRREFRRQLVQFEPVFTRFVMEQRRLLRDDARESGPLTYTFDEDGEKYELHALSELDYSGVAVPADELPRFTWRPPTAGALAARAAADVLSMLVFVAVLMAWTLWRFTTYDCR